MKANNRNIIIILVILLVLILAFFYYSYIVSDAKYYKSESSTVLKICHTYSATQKLEFDRQIKEFNETLGLKENIMIESMYLKDENIVLEVISKYVADNSAYSRDRIPDIFIVTPEVAYEIDRLLSIASLEEFFVKREIEEFLDLSLRKCYINEELKMIPLSLDTEVLMINNTDWEKFANNAGLDKSCFSTWEELREASALYYKYTDDKTLRPYNGKALFGHNSLYNLVITGFDQMDEEFIIDNNGSTEINFDKNIFKKIWDCYYIPYVCGYYSKDRRYVIDDINTGSVISVATNASEAQFFPETVTLEELPYNSNTYPIDMLTLPLPTFEGYNSNALMIEEGFVIKENENEDEKNSCVKFIKWFTEEQRNLDYALVSGYMPVKIDVTKEQDLVLERLSVIEYEKDLNLPSPIIRTVPVSIGLISNSKKITTENFDKSYLIKQTLEETLETRLNKDAMLFLATLKTGEDFDELLLEFDNYENFMDCYNELIFKLREIVY